MTSNAQDARDQVPNADDYKRLKLSPVQTALDAWLGNAIKELSADGIWNKWTAARVWRSFHASDILKDHGQSPVSANEKLVLQFIAERYNVKEKKAWPRVGDIAVSLDLSTKTVERALHRLEWMGAIAGRRREGRSVEWKIVGVDFAERTITSKDPIRKPMAGSDIATLRNGGSTTSDMGVEGSVNISVSDVNGTTDMGVEGYLRHGCRGTSDMGVVVDATPMSDQIRKDKSEDKESDKSPRAFGAPPEGGYIPPSADGDMRDGASLDERSATEPAIDQASASISVKTNVVPLRRPPVQSENRRASSMPNATADHQRLARQATATARAVRTEVKERFPLPVEMHEEARAIAREFDLDPEAMVQSYRSHSGKPATLDGFRIHCECEVDPPF